MKILKTTALVLAGFLLASTMKAQVYTNQYPEKLQKMAAKWVKKGEWKNGFTMEGDVQMAGGNGLARHSERKATDSRHQPHGERGGQRKLVFGRRPEGRQGQRKPLAED